MIFKALKIRAIGKNDVTAEISNLASISELKDVYIIKFPDLEKPLLRMFCMGRELKDELFMYSYDIKDVMVV